MKKFIRWSWFACFLGEFEWYRRLYGGKWARVWVDDPCYSCLWLNLPDWANESYRELNWRGKPEFRDYNVDKPLAKHSTFGN